MKIVFKEKSFIGMLIVFPIIMFLMLIFMVYGYEIDMIFEIISYIIVIAIALFLIPVMGYYFLDKEENKDISKTQRVIKFIICLILILATTSAILIISEIREILFTLLKILYFILTIAWLNLFISNLKKS